ncbi:MAG: ferrous iron transport protein A [Flavobacteriaceae bacterium]|jgi:ferrous iron transport protein A|nr:ferrous iron transport protein A [Flavobacteriaceae bacterium]
MDLTLADLEIGDVATIESFDVEKLPMKLIEMGCLPGNKVNLLQVAPSKDPLYLNISGSFLAIRRETALQIIVRK